MIMAQMTQTVTMTDDTIDIASDALHYISFACVCKVKNSMYSIHSIHTQTQLVEQQYTHCAYMRPVHIIHF
jgi:hypothetical protein